MKFIKSSGLVIKETISGDSDKILTLLVGEYGKISVFSKGSRRTNSKYIGSSQLLTYSNFNLFKGKTMYYINSCDIVESFYEFRNDLTKLTYASHICDIILDVVYENQPSNDILRLTLNSLYFLSNSLKDENLILSIFNLKLLTYLGYRPLTNTCALCNCADEDSLIFSIKNGGFICNQCKYKDPNFFEISPPLRPAIIHIVSSKLESCFKLTLSSSLILELSILTKKLLENKLEKKYTKLEFLNKCKL